MERIHPCLINYYADNTNLSNMPIFRIKCNDYCDLNVISLKISSQNKLAKYTLVHHHFTWRTMLLNCYSLCDHNYYRCLLQVLAMLSGEELQSQ